MAFENNWVTYLQRSYKSIKASILTRMETTVPEITDRSESNIFVVIVSAFAGLIEQINYYIDNMAREVYLPTARRYSSLVKITRLFDYRVRAKIGSTVDLLVTALDGSAATFNVTSAVTISKGAIVKTDLNIEFITTEDRAIPIGNSSVLVPAKQRKLYSNQNIGTTTSSSGQAYKLDADYQHDTLQITINSLTWELRESLSFSGPQDRHFIVEVNEAKEAWVIFGDNVHGAIPTTGYAILATFYKCSGVSGNVIADSITTWVSGKPIGGGANDFIVTNPQPAVGGLEVEGMEGIRRHAPLSLRTLDRAVTLQDHLDLAMLVPGVGKAALEYNSNFKALKFYIAPDGGGVASTQLCTDVVDYFAIRKMISTTIMAVPSGETYLRITITATAKFRRSGADTKTDIENALLTYFGFNYSDVNKSIRRSDIISLVDNLDKVDFLSLDILTTKPYPRITNGTDDISTTWYITVNSTAITKARWRINIVNATTRVARLYRTDTGTGIESFDREFSYDLTYQGNPQQISSVAGELAFCIFGAFTNGDEWEFTTYGYNSDIVFDDFTVPIAKISELSITVNEQMI